jgi:hypothetical protein
MVKVQTRLPATSLVDIWPMLGGTVVMANVKKGQLVPAPEWWKHLRWAKRGFWKSHRRAEKREAAENLADSVRLNARHNGET